MDRPEIKNREEHKEFWECEKDLCKVPVVWVKDPENVSGEEMAQIITCLHKDEAVQVIFNETGELTAEADAHSIHSKAESFFNALDPNPYSKNKTRWNCLWGRAGGHLGPSHESNYKINGRMVGILKMS